MHRVLLSVATVLAFVGSASAQPTPMGDWLTAGASAVVRIAPCPSDEGTLCGRITWLWDPSTSADTRNADPALRSRPLVGLEMLQGFRPARPGEWTGGSIYNPEDGNSYSASLKLRDATTLDVRGCVLFICRSQVWRRPSALPR
ncbi:MAG: DUF2147 domain-containing protein [Alphaproteobacteria bacterium]|nr:DUF2147 domain-containing protein [Alphaproteobacteria bacterium]MCW5743720.1 DUF2147 domain-containing protein [Alphaproteobacteria bacterium]